MALSLINTGKITLFHKKVILIMSIFNYINEIAAPRSDINKKHELMDVIFLVFVAVLSEVSGWKSIQEFSGVLDVNLSGRCVTTQRPRWYGTDKWYSLIGLHKCD